ncbi:MAG: hypothetical protein ACUVRH_02195 [Candidatus Bipolaricaulia bacterium]
MAYPEFVRAFLAYLISHTGRLDGEKRARLRARIALERLALDDLAYEALEGTHLGWRDILGLTRRGRAVARSRSEGPFSEIFAGPARAVEYESERHPPLSALEGYLNGDLEDQRPLWDQGSLEDLIRGRVKDWGLSEVSLHLATCRECAAKVAELRALELARASSEGERGQIIRRRWAYQLLAPVVSVVLLAIFISTVFFQHSFLFFRHAAQPGSSPSEESQIEVVVHEDWEEFQEDFLPLGRHLSSPWPR